jgi:tetratricopeptide (TPR) repeat protein
MASQAQLKAAEEAEKLYDKGDSYTKRTLTRWSPDWTEAASHFERAAVKYRSAGKDFHPRLAKTLLRAAEAYEELSSLNSSAKCISQAMNILANLNDTELKNEAAALCRKASDLYRANGQIDKAAQTLVKGASFFDAEHFKKALEYFKDALSLYQEENREIQSHDTYKQAIAYSIKYQEFDTAVQLLADEAVAYKKQSSNSMHGCYLGIIVCSLLKILQFDLSFSRSFTALGGNT